ncbi:unnamed protein product [Absidia cylindrospora]
MRPSQYRVSNQFGEVMNAINNSNNNDKGSWTTLLDYYRHKGDITWSMDEFQQKVLQSTTTTHLLCPIPYLSYHIILLVRPGRTPKDLRTVFSDDAIRSLEDHLTLYYGVGDHAFSDDVFR